VTDSVRVGTRRSRLARRQTGIVLDRLRRSAPDRRFRTVPIETSGDRDRRPGVAPDFTDAIDRALRRGELDLAVHSAKDLPVELDPSLCLAACPPRADPRDCLVLPLRPRSSALARGARVGSSSLRRRAQLLRWRPDLEVVEVRGNVDTRIGLVRSGRVDAVILAVAGLQRLGRGAEAGPRLPLSRFLPAPAQGALAVVTRAGDDELGRLAGRIDHAPTRARVTAERAFAAALGGDCRVPLGALASVRGPTVALVGEVLSPDGRTSLRRVRSGLRTSADGLGARLGREMLDAGALDLLASARR